MPKAEIVKSQNKVIAIIVKKKTKVKEIEFFTPRSYPFQIGLHHRKKGTVLKPHLHPLCCFYIKSSQEVLYVLEGKIKIELFGNNKKFLENKILKTGDSILFVSGGHGVKFLKNSRVFEVKQGPYRGKEKSKIFI